MAFTKKEKQEMLSNYEQWLTENKGIILAEYSKMKMKDIDNLRAKVRENGGNLHVAKNTLLERALANKNLDTKGELVGTTMLGYAPDDPPALAKIFSDASKTDFIEIKWGYLDGKLLEENEIKALADLPPLPVMQAKLLGVLMAPASKFVRTLAEPGRQIAAVVKAYSEKGEAVA